MMTSRGGFWNTTKLNYSNETKNLLKALMAEANVSSPFRQNINSKLHNGDSLDPVIQSKTLDTRHALRKKKSDFTKESRLSRSGLRTKNMIDAQAVQKEPPYRPPPIPPSAGASEKARLAHMMTYGVDPLTKRPTIGSTMNARADYLRRRLEGTRKAGAEEDNDGEQEEDRFTELIREVKERREFLRKMSEFGQEKVYRNKIETEISQLVREMELIDYKRSAELAKALEHADRQRKGGSQLTENQGEETSD